MENVLWELDCRDEDEAFHNGADVSMLSQFATEKEVLFPPLTMLAVCGPHNEPSIQEDEIIETDKVTGDKVIKRFIRIRAVPYYV